MGRGRVYNDETKELARKIFLRTKDAKATALEMGIPPRTVQGWVKRHHWDKPIMREVQERIASAGAEICADATERLAALADEALEDTLKQVPRTIVVAREKAAQACRHLAETRNLIIGKAGGDGEQRPFTFQQLIFIATGSEGERIAGSVEDPQGPGVVPAKHSRL